MDRSLSVIRLWSSGALLTTDLVFNEPNVRLTDDILVNYPDADFSAIVVDSTYVSPKVCLPCQKSDHSIPQKSDVFKINDNYIIEICWLIYLHYASISLVYYSGNNNIHSLTCTDLATNRFLIFGRADRQALRYGGFRASVTLCDRGRGGQNWPKKRYVIVERPHTYSAI